jgi:hypothetical protein
LLKVSNVEIMGDPFALWAGKVGGYPAIDPDRYRDPEAAKLLLLALEAHSTIDGLYDQDVTLSNGIRLRFTDCSARIRLGLAQREEAFRREWRERARDVERLGGPNWRKEMNSDTFFWEAILGCTRDTARYLSTLGAARVDTEDELWQLSFCYNGYILARNIRSLNNYGPASFDLDANDVEDSEICAYLDVRNDDILVTNDKGTIEALERAFQVYDAHCQGMRRCRVMTPDAYVAAFLPKE